MRAGRIEQLDTPQRVFEEPATEYVAGFIGMSNRVELHRDGTGWIVSNAGAESVGISGALPIPRGVDVVAARLRPDDVQLLPAGEARPAGGVTLPAEVVDAQFGGRHMDIVLTVAGVRIHARAPLAGQSWVRSLTAGQRVTAWYADGTAIYYGVDGERIPAPAPAATVGA
jgi:iron(III) transport system ATP-binding protein